MRARLFAAVAIVAIVASGCSDDKDKPESGAPSVKEIDSAIALSTSAPAGAKVGLILSTAGPGKDVRELAAGAYVAEYRVNAAKADSMRLVVEDDLGTPEGAVAAVDRLADEGVVGIVYASLGDQAKAAADRAAERNVALLAPYAADGALTSAATTFLTGPTEQQAASELTEYVKSKALTPVAVVHQTGPYGDRGRELLGGAGLEVQHDVTFDPASDDPSAPVKTLAASEPGVVIAWTELDGAVRLLSEMKAAGVSAPVLFAPRVAVPAFGRAQKALTAPAATDGLLSAGTWVGPWTPTAAVDAFYAARNKAASEGARADLTNAEMRSHDAVLALLAAADAADSNEPAQVVVALRSLGKVGGAAGAAAQYGNPASVNDGDVALLTYSTLDDGRGRLPDPNTGGGTWIAVTGTYQLPEALAGLDEPFGG